MCRHAHAACRHAYAAFAALLLVLAAGQVADAGDACAPPAQAMQQIELLFGRNIGGRLGVGDAAWARFLSREISPSFSDGLTVIDAAGEWRGAQHRQVRERAKLVIIVTPDAEAARIRIAAIVAAYKAQFRQQSVLVVTRPVCAAF
jgi:hypothetical protein